MEEMVWLIAFVWVILLGFSYIRYSPGIRGFSAVIGWILSYMVAGDSVLFTLILFFLNVYVLYTVVVEESGSK